MTEDTQRDAASRNRLREVAQQELAKFERKENDFRKKDRQERAAALRLPLDKINIHCARADGPEAFKTASSASRPMR